MRRVLSVKTKTRIKVKSELPSVGDVLKKIKDLRRDFVTLCIVISVMCLICLLFGLSSHFVYSMLFASNIAGGLASLHALGGLLLTLWTFLSYMNRDEP